MKGPPAREAARARGTTVAATVQAAIAPVEVLKYMNTL